MRRSPRVSQSPFEVRCPRCDVSFPVGTKDCIHCGGQTGPPGAMPSMSTGVDTGSDFEPGPNLASPDAFDDDGFHASYGSGDAAYSASNPGAEGTREPFGMGDFGGAAPGDAEVYDREDDGLGEAQSPMRAILSSLGGMVWIVLFILISIARSCGE